MEMLDDQYSDNEKDYGAWMKLIDREGLKHVYILYLCLWKDLLDKVDMFTKNNSH